MRLPTLKTARFAALVAGAALAAGLAAAPAQAEITGTLQCNVAAGLGVIVVSQRTLSCTFMSAAGPTELYNGSISRLGVDIGQITGGTLTYQVLQAGVAAPGALAGTYVGPGFGVTVGTGGGLNALVGGNGNSITLQPISATTSTGLNVNAGIGALNLAFTGMAAPVRHGRHHHRLHHHGFSRPHMHHHHHPM